MAMAMKIDRSLVHPSPRAEGIVAKDDKNFGDRELGVELNARPFSTLRDHSIVVVSHDEVFSASQGMKETCDALRRLPNGEVTEVPHFVLIANNRVPAGDHLLVHLLHRRKGAAIEGSRCCIAEMVVAGEEDRHTLIAL